MSINQTAFNQIATSLSMHYDSLYYVEIETGNFTEFIHSNMFEKLKLPKEGSDFFGMASSNANKFVHPDDLENVLRIHDKSTILENLSKNYSYSISCRLIINGKIIHVRHVDIMCEDKKHILCCMENIEDEFQEKAEQEKNLQSAERMARRDELTGIKNKNAFSEYSKNLDEKIKEKIKNFQFGILMCDLNDLKILNDTRGHSFGDEAIQKPSRMICDVFKHSPVFRIGGDEFVAILTDSDYKNREKLLKVLREESEKNRKTNTGPSVASGIAVYDSNNNDDFSAVFKRADQEMYNNKNFIKSKNSFENLKKTTEKEISTENKRKLDKLFGALYTISGKAYVYLNDLRYDYSRWSLPLIDDFGLESEYMYHADKIWRNYVHPDDLEAYETAVNTVLGEKAEIKAIYYRARKKDGTYVLLSTRGFVLKDDKGTPEYFGGIIIPM